MSGNPHPIAKLPGVSEAVKFVKSTSVTALPVPWPRCQDAAGADFGNPTKDDLVIAISHAWSYQVHPDPLGEKVKVIDDTMKKAAADRRPSGNTLFFYDLLSVPQRPFRSGQPARTKEEDDKFAIGLKAFPNIYLMADATVHVDVETAAVPTDGDVYTVPLGSLRDVSLMQLGPAIQVVASGIPDCEPFDFLTSIDGSLVKTMRDVEHALEAEGRKPKRPEQASLWCSCINSAESAAQLTSANYGKRNMLKADVKGWIYLERFASMVKVAMTHRSQAAGLVFTNSDSIREQIYAGAERLREAAANGALEKVLNHFAAELDTKQFSAASIDKQTNTGGQGGLETDVINSGAYSASDSAVVWLLMKEMVDYLSANWAVEQRKQEHRQIVLAVDRGDVESLENILSARADPNTPDENRSTVLHEAAVSHKTDAVRVLLRYGADILAQDAQGAIPAHRVWLKTDVNVSAPDNFRLLAPTLEALEAKNQADVTPLQRFHTWASTAVDGEEFPPGMAVVDEALKRFPGLQLDQEEDEEGDQDIGDEVNESTMECTVGSRNIQVHTVEHAADATHHILFLAMGIFCPLAGNLAGARCVSRQIAACNPVKVHILTMEVFDPKIYSDVGSEAHEALLNSLSIIIEALQLHEKFVLVDNSGGMLTGIVWRLHARQRLAGALLLNIFGYYPLDFAETEMSKTVNNMLNFFRPKFAAMDMEFLRMSISISTLQRGKKMLQANTDRWNRDCEQLPEHWLKYHASRLSWDLMTISRAYGDAEPLAHQVPMAIAVSDQAPELLWVASSLRLQRQLGIEKMEYIPQSKTAWPYEGLKQRNKVSSLLADVTRRAFNFSKPIAHPIANTTAAEGSPVSGNGQQATTHAQAKSTAGGSSAAGSKAGQPGGCCILQ